MVATGHASLSKGYLVALSERRISPDSPVTENERGLRTAGKVIWALIGGLGVLVVILGNFLGVAFRIFPNLEPPEPVTQVEAVVQGVSLEAGSLLEYDRRFGRDAFTRELERTIVSQPRLRGFFPGKNARSRAAIAARDESGVIAFAEIASKGLDLGTPRFYLMSAQTRRRAAGPPSVVATVFDVSGRANGKRLLRTASQPQFSARVTADRQVAVAFLACNATVETIFVRVEVRDLSGERPILADVADSDPIKCS